MLRDRTLAEEIVQEFFIAIWEQPPLVSDSVKSYFYKSIYNRALNHIEKAKTRLRNEENYSIENERELELEDNDLDLQNRIHTAVQELPEKCKEIFVLCKYNELSYSQVSEMLSISPKTVENQMGIALKKLREILLPFLGRKKY
jgi:RNA polymerase sigma-70 factor, ECF subfamily